jgi:AraC-like DNA-binding protein
MNHIDFCKSFFFTEYRYERSHYTDARSGASRHFIGMLEQGRCRIVSSSVTIEAGPGEPFYIPMGLPYQSFWYSDSTILLRSYGFEHFPEAGSFLLQTLPVRLAESVRTIPLTGQPDSEALGRLFSVLAQALPHMIRSTTGSTVCLWEQAVAYMQQNRDCRTAEIARHCGVSESAIYAAFQRHGSTPNQTRQKLLVEEAVRLLTTTDESIQNISDRLGFSSASYFRKILAAHTGKTPTQHRRSASHV